MYIISYVRLQMNFEKVVEAAVIALLTVDNFFCRGNLVEIFCFLFFVCFFFFVFFCFFVFVFQIFWGLFLNFFLFFVFFFIKRLFLSLNLS